LSLIEGGASGRRPLPPPLISLPQPLIPSCNQSTNYYSGDACVATAQAKACGYILIASRLRLGMKGGSRASSPCWPGQDARVTCISASRQRTWGKIGKDGFPPPYFLAFLYKNPNSIALCPGIPRKNIMLLPSDRKPINNSRAAVSGRYGWRARRPALPGIFKRNIRDVSYRLITTRSHRPF
jgi:hypothetical protein